MSAAAPTMSAAASTMSFANKPASAAPRNPAIQALVTSSDSGAAGTSSDSGVAGTNNHDAPSSPTAARALTPRGGYYLNRSTGRVVSWAELKDMEREGEGDMTYFCAVM
ncbi:lipopeptide mating pheromone precursor bbp2-6 [Schizophyllum commune]